MATTTVSRAVTLDQKRAKRAWELIENVERKVPKERAECGRETKKLPARIIACGLGQAIAFLNAKATAKKPGLRILIDGLSEHVQAQIPVKSGPTDILQRIIEGDAVFLRRATDETLAYLQWLGRFVEAKGWAKDDVAKDDEQGD